MEEHEAFIAYLDKSFPPRSPDVMFDKFGEETYESELCNCLWGVYQMLGKLSPRIYTIEKMPL